MEKTNKKNVRLIFRIQLESFGILILSPTPIKIFTMSLGVPSIQFPQIILLVFPGFLYSVLEGAINRDDPTSPGRQNKEGDLMGDIGGLVTSGFYREVN